MAVHVPLSAKAIKEARDLMLPKQNLLRPADGSPITTPASKEMALGVYYLTSEDNKIAPYGTVFADRDEAILAFQNEIVELRQKITIRIGGEIIDTTIGRILFNEALPKDFEFINEAITSSQIKEIFKKAYEESERERVVKMIDAIKDLGFVGGTISGLSFGIFDSKVLPEKEKILKDADSKVAEHENNFAMGLITAEEKRHLTQEVWIEVTEDLADKTWELLDESSPIRTVIDAKVGRASRDQVKQLAAIRGLVVDPLGKIVELPIKSNFREGLSVFEYVTSSRGSRKGLTDTALKTADAGYLTRRLVDVAHDVIIRLQDCGVKEGLTIKREPRPKTFAARMAGRFASEDIINPKGKKVIVAKLILIKPMRLQNWRLAKLCCTLP
jgi:DNA-directed RNA polymerase subunit beta'